MSTTKGALALERKDAKNHDSLISLAREYFQRNPHTDPKAAQKIEDALKRFAGVCEEMAAQLEEPGFSQRPHNSIFSEQDGLTREQAETLVYYHLDGVVDLYVEHLADEMEAWMRQDMGVHG